MNHNLNKSSIMPEDFLPSVESQDSFRIIPSYIKNECQCELCANDYDLSIRVPMMLCDNQHHCCLNCVNQIITRKRQCPFCRKQIQINKIFKNRIICKILEQMAKKQGIKIKINQNPQKMIKNNDVIILPEQNYNHPPLWIPPGIPQIIRNDNQIQQNLLINNAEEVPPSCFQRIQIGKGVYPVAYMICFIINTPFFITEMIYALTIEYQNCMDIDYGVGMSLRTWFFSSSLIGISMFFLQFIILMSKICFYSYKKLPKILSWMNILFFVLKFLGYNILGLVVNGYIDIDAQNECDSGVAGYMTAILVILIVIFSSICALLDSR